MPEKVLGAAFIIPLLLLSNASANNWPCFHGSLRDNKSTETGLLKTWPENGPPLLWSVSGLGEGYSSVSISDNRVFVAGMSEKQGVITALDLTGKKLWSAPNGAAWEAAAAHARSYTGARSTPTVDGSVVYHLGESGRLAAFRVSDGKELWAVDIRERFDAPVPKYGYAESVLIDGGRLYCSPAGAKGFTVCLDKSSGNTIWTNTSIQGAAGYNSPITFSHAGRRQFVSISSEIVFGLDMADGKFLWSSALSNNRQNNCTDPVFHNGHVFVSSGYGAGSRLLRLAATSSVDTATTVWSNERLDNHHGGVILHEGYLYGAGHNARGWHCLDFATGTQKWQAPGKGSVTYADGMLYILEENGTVRLVQATPDAFTESGSFTAPGVVNSQCWAHPVVCGRRLYVRIDEYLRVYDISASNRS